MYVQPACLSSIAVWIVDLPHAKSPDRNSEGIEFVVSAAGVHETAPSISASKANRYLNEFMAFKWNWPVASEQSPLVECRVIGIAVMSGCTGEHSTIRVIIVVIGGVAVTPACTSERSPIGIGVILVGRVSIGPARARERIPIGIVVILVGGIAVSSARAGEHSAVGTVITVISGVAVGAAGAVYQLGFDRKGGTENYGGKGEFCQSFHSF